MSSSTDSGVGRKSILLVVVAAAVAVPTAMGVSGSDTIVTVAGTGVAGHSGDGGQATSAQLNEPVGLAVDAKGDLYIADCSDNTVRKLSNGTITTVAGTSGKAGYSGDGGPATQAQLDCPAGLAFDPQGTLYISDSRNNRIREVKDGIITTVAGNGVAGYNGDGIAATSAKLDVPWGIAVDADSNLYIADIDNNRIRKVSGGTITTVAGDGIVAFGGDGGPATEAQLQYPYDVAVDAQGDLYIADDGNNRIRKVSGGTITTVVGGGTSPGDGGPATSATLNDAPGIVVDARGDLYIAEFGESRIRRVSGGTITTVAGTGTKGFSGDGGQATSAQVYFPWEVAVDHRGNLYIADAGNHRVREILNKPPTASFTASPPSGRVPLTVKFDSSASSDPDGQVTKVVWDFGDGATAGAPKTSHTYTKAGTFQVKLTVTDDSGATATATKEVAVTAGVKLTASGFSVGKAQAGKPFTASFTVRSGGKGVKGSLSCSAKLNGKPLAASHHSTSSSGAASCAWNLPGSSRGERLAGSISESYKGAKASRSFSVKVA
jgi:PKD repeat protein